MPSKSISLSGEVHISTEQVYTTVDALEALKEIGSAYGFYSRAEELRGQRVHLDKRDGHSVLVVQEDLSLHGSPCWETTHTVTDDPVQIQRYMAFREVLHSIQQIDRERAQAANRQINSSRPNRPLKGDRNSHER